MLLFDEYNETLNSQLQKHGLKHGFVMFKEGEFCRHLIYLENGTESTLWGLVKRPRRMKVAEIVTEPSSIVPFMQGAAKGAGVSCTLLNPAYADAVESAISAVNNLVAGGGSRVFPPSELNVIEWV